MVTPGTVSNGMWAGTPGACTLCSVAPWHPVLRCWVQLIRACAGVTKATLQLLQPALTAAIPSWPVKGAAWRWCLTPGLQADLPPRVHAGAGALLGGRRVAAPAAHRASAAGGGGTQPQPRPRCGARARHAGAWPEHPARGRHAAAPGAGHAAAACGGGAPTHAGGGTAVRSGWLHMEDARVRPGMACCCNGEQTLHMLTCCRVLCAGAGDAGPGTLPGPPPPAACPGWHGWVPGRPCTWAARREETAWSSLAASKLNMLVSSVNTACSHFVSCSSQPLRNSSLYFGHCSMWPQLSPCSGIEYSWHAELNHLLQPLSAGATLEFSPLLACMQK